jgi:hypothetical protein
MNARGTMKYGDRDEPREIHRAARFIVARAVDGDRQPIVIKALRPDRPGDRSSLAVLRKEYQTLRGLDVPGVVRAIRFGLRLRSGIASLWIYCLLPSGTRPRR